jgi:hypothetical protein
LIGLVTLAKWLTCDAINLLEIWTRKTLSKSEQNQAFLMHLKNNDDECTRLEDAAPIQRAQCSFFSCLEAV